MTGRIKTKIIQHEPNSFFICFLKCRPKLNYTVSESGSLSAFLIKLLTVSICLFIIPCGPFFPINNLSICPKFSTSSTDFILSSTESLNYFLFSMRNIFVKDKKHSLYVSIHYLHNALFNR